MTETQPMSKAELLAKIEQSWTDFNGYIATLTPSQVTVPTDAAGWTALDHLIHLADWENGVLAMLNKQDRAAAMGVDSATWASQEFDKINDILQKKGKGKSIFQAREFVMGVHQQFVEKIQSLSDEDLQRPYKYYQPQSDREAPVIQWVQMNTYEHYDEHKPWIEAIVASEKPLSKVDLLAIVDKGWDALNEFIKGLSDAQKTQPTDAAGWTVKDHVVHMAVWEDGLTAMLDQKDRRIHMNIDEETWKSGDDPINAVIQQRYKDLSWAEVEQKRQTIHAYLLKQIDGMSEQALQSPNPKSKSKYVINDYIIASTADHYAEHIPWMAAIAAGQ